MSNLLPILQNEHLFDIQWDPSKFKIIFQEIISLFHLQKKQIEQLQEQIENSVSKNTIDDLKLNFNEFKQDTLTQIDELFEIKINNKKEFKQVIY